MMVMALGYEFGQPATEADQLRYRAALERPPKGSTATPRVVFVSALTKRPIRIGARQHRRCRELELRDQSRPRQAFRVIRPCRRLAVSDIINTAPLPAELQADPALLCGCIAGADRADRVEGWLARARFVDIRVVPNTGSCDLIKTRAPGWDIENLIVSAIVEGPQAVRGGRRI